MGLLKPLRRSNQPVRWTNSSWSIYVLWLLARARGGRGNASLSIQSHAPFRPDNRICSTSIEFELDVGPVERPSSGVEVPPPNAVAQFDPKRGGLCIGTRQTPCCRSLPSGSATRRLMFAAVAAAE